MPRIFTCDQLGEIGMLGNQLFQVAGTLRRAFRHGPEASVALHPDWPYRRYFSIPDSQFGHVLYDPLHSYEDCEGYLQDKAENFGDYDPRGGSECDEAVLWQWFKPSKFAVDEALDFWRYGGELDRTIAIHVRLGDYLYYPDVFVKLDWDYYKAALGLLLSGSGDKFDQVFVFSDNIERAMGELEGIGRDLIPVKKLTHPYEDVLTLQFMARCGGFVIANSTFSWWAARLSGSEHVVMPSRWGMNSSPMGIEFQKRALDLKVSWWKQIWGAV